MNGEILGRMTALILFPLLLMAIIGGVYYLVNRPSVGFRQAMFRWWVVVLALGLTLLGVMGQIVNGATAAA